MQGPAPDTLACPHCERVFRSAPAFHGKVIRCRGCRQMFAIPVQFDQPDVQPAAPVSVGRQWLPVSIAAWSDGRNLRQCPACHRRFSMRATLAGKTIRCRGCKVLFRVGPDAALVTAPLARASRHPAVIEQQHARGVPEDAGARALHTPASVVSDDSGDVVAEWTPGESSAWATRPKLPRRVNENGVQAVVGVICGGLIGIVSAQVILWWVFRSDPLKLAPKLPSGLRWIAPARL